MQTIQAFIGTTLETTIGTSESQPFLNLDQKDMIEANAVLLANTDDAGGIIYVHRKTGLTAKKCLYTLYPGETQLIPWHPKLVFILGSQANVDFTAEQVKVY